MVYHPQGQGPLGIAMAMAALFRRWWRSTGLAPSARGYRFGNHPMTRGPVRRRDTDHGHDESWIDPMDPHRI